MMQLKLYIEDVPLIKLKYKSMYVSILGIVWLLCCIAHIWTDQECNYWDS